NLLARWAVLAGVWFPGLSRRRYCPPLPASGNAVRMPWQYAAARRPVNPPLAPIGGMSAKRLTVPGFVGLKSSGKKICMVTAYDYPQGRMADAADVDSVLVGDSLGMVVQGHETTLPVTLDQIIYHAEMVGRAVEQALVVVDMAFPTLLLGRERAVEHAARIL